MAFVCLSQPAYVGHWRGLPIFVKQVLHISATKLALFNQFLQPDILVQIGIDPMT